MQDQINELDKQETKLFALYHNFDTKGTNPVFELNYLVNSLLGLNSPQNKQDWFDFALGNVKVLSQADQEFLENSETQFMELLNERITKIFTSKLQTKLEEGQKDPAFEDDSESKLDFFDSFLDEVKEVSIELYRKLNLSKIHKRLTGGEVHNGMLFLKEISKIIDGLMKNFNGEFNKRSGKQHSYTQGKDGQITWENEELHDKDKRNLESNNEIINLYNSKGIKISNQVQAEVQPNLHMLDGFFNNLKFYVAKEVEKLQQVAKTLSAQDSQALGLRYKDLTTKLIKITLKKEGAAKLETLPNSLLIAYKAAVENESDDSSVYNQVILPSLVSNFLMAYEQNYDPKGEAQEKTLLLLNRFLNLIHRESKFSQMSYVTKEAITHVNEDNELFGHDLADKIRLLNLALEYPQIKTELSENYGDLILSNSNDILSLSRKVIKTNGALSKLFYSFVASENDKEFFETLYGLVIDFIVAKSETVERNNLKEEFSSFIDARHESQQFEVPLYYALKIQALISVPGDNYQIHFTQFNDDVLESSIESFGDEKYEGVVRSLEYGFQENETEKQRAIREEEADLITILKFINGKTFESQTFRTINVKIVI